uniref:Uncharacterized protein n=1 Tax=Oryza brachyantha TaxID=4533 RepID=J3MED0_ORYBR
MGATTNECPYTIHLLAHLYLIDLYAIRCPLPSCLPPSLPGFGAMCCGVVGCEQDQCEVRFSWKSFLQGVKDTPPKLADIWRIG